VHLKFTILFLFSGWIFCLPAQTNIHLGLVAGKTFSGATFSYPAQDNHVSLRTRVGNMVGIQNQIGITNHMAIRTGIILVEKGMVFESHLPGYHYRIDHRFVNAELSTALSLRIALSERLYLHEVIGIEFDIVSNTNGPHYPAGWLNQPDFVFFDRLNQHFAANVLAGFEFGWEWKHGAAFNLGVAYHQGLWMLNKGVLQYKWGDEWITREVLINGSYVAITASCYLPEGNLRYLFQR
jgi:hypothetical protein